MSEYNNPFEKPQERLRPQISAITELHEKTEEIKRQLRQLTLEELTELVLHAPELEAVNEEIEYLLGAAPEQELFDRTTSPHTRAELLLSRYPLRDSLANPYPKPTLPEEEAILLPRLSKKLHEATGRLGAKILGATPADQQIQMTESLDRLEQADETVLKNLGVDITSAWLIPVVRRLTIGGPIVVHAVKAEACQATYSYPFEAPQRLSTQQMQLRHANLGAQLCEISNFHTTANLGQTLYIDDQADAKGRPARRSHRIAFALHVLDHFSNQPLVKLSDFSLKRSGSMHHVLDTHTYSPPPSHPDARLQIRTLHERRSVFETAAVKGSTVIDSLPFGHVVDVPFHQNNNRPAYALDYYPPETHILQHIISIERQNEIKEGGIRLRNPDRSLTRTGQIVSSLFDETGQIDADERYLKEATMHLIIADEKERRAYEEAFLVIGAYDPHALTLLRPIFVDYSKISDEQADYAILLQLAKAADSSKQSIENFEIAKPMNARETWNYLHHNYGVLIPAEAKGPLGKIKEDQEIIERLMPLLPILFPDGINSLVVDGWGPYTYLGQLLEVYVKQGADINANDISAANIKIAQDWKQGSIDPETDQVARDFEEIMVALGDRYEHPTLGILGALYKDSDARTRKRLEVEYGDITNLKRASTQVRAQGFVTCSSSTSKEYFWNVVQGMADSLTADGTLISLHMVGSKQWGRFPSVPLSVEEIRQAYINAGLDVIVTPITGGSLREGYEGMVIVIARKINPSDPLRDVLHRGLQKMQDFGPTSNTILGNECPLGCAMCEINSVGLQESVH